MTAKGAIDNFEKGSRRSSAPKRTCLERVLIFLLVSTIIVIVVLVVLLVMALKPEPTEICLTKECTAIAARVNSFIDYNVAPCDDFYDFACGTWMKRNFIPEDSSGIYVHAVLRNNVRRTIKNLLESTKDDNVEAVKKAKDYYRSCMNETYIEELNASVMLNFLEQLGGWPTLEDQPGGRWNQSAFDLIENLAATRIYKTSPLIHVRVVPDEMKNNQRIIKIGEPAFSMSGRSYYYDDRYSVIRNAFVTFAKNLGVLLGANADVAERDVLDAFEIDKRLSNFTLTNVESRNKSITYNKMTVAELEANYSPPDSNTHNFNWTIYLQSVLDIAQQNITIDSTEEVILESPRYYKHLFEILNDVSKRTIKNYLIHHTVFVLLNSLPKRFADLRAKYFQVSMGTINQQSRWKMCADHTLQVFGMAVGRLFVEDNFDEEAKEKALEMIHGIRDVLFETFIDIEWMDQKTKQVARDKAKGIREQIGYPDFILNDKDLNDYYEQMNLDIEADAFFNNTLQILRVFGKATLENLREPYEKDYDSWPMSPTTVNAFYYPLYNLISFPAAMLQPPYYSKYQPRSMNYGGIGWLIGHEITHAFDDSGRKYDKHGNLRQWWTNYAIANFNGRTRCFKKQYNNYVSTMANMSLDGEYTLGENIADNGGLQHCFKAYKRWQRKTGTKEPSLPGLDFTHEQLFFISFAQGWCGKSTKEGETHMINTDTHSPWRFRITGSLQNSYDFARAFNCPRGSPMNPVKKCKIW